MLTVRQERVTGEGVGIPERELPAVQRLDEKPLPGVVFQNQVAEQVVVGVGDAEIASSCPVWLVEEQDVGGQESL